MKHQALLTGLIRFIDNSVGWLLLGPPCIVSTGGVTGWLSAQCRHGDDRWAGTVRRRRHSADDKRWRHEWRHQMELYVKVFRSADKSVLSS